MRDIFTSVELWISKISTTGLKIYPRLFMNGTTVSLTNGVLCYITMWYDRPIFLWGGRCDCETQTLFLNVAKFSAAKNGLLKKRDWETCDSNSMGLQLTQPDIHLMFWEKFFLDIWSLWGGDEDWGSSVTQFEHLWFISLSISEGKWV